MRTVVVRVRVGRVWDFFLPAAGARYKYETFLSKFSNGTRVRARERENAATTLITASVAVDSSAGKSRESELNISERSAIDVSIFPSSIEKLYVS